MPYYSLLISLEFKLFEKLRNIGSKWPAKGRKGTFC